ncbi:hypothetical protein QM012_003255 [Aureobasidium pullulans]|uniref:BZIP domain-containing protein n=1 Tax=Aureobasidium pullulans TaxID=5580 RepID=A0ABR0T9P9_AURPU
MAGRYTTVHPAQLIIDERTIMKNNAHMTNFGDANFCVWIMKQLVTVARWHMVEPFIRLPDPWVDLHSINQRLHTGGVSSGYPDAATFQEDLLSIPINWLQHNSGQTHRHAKANDLMLELPALFRSRNRVDNAYRRSQQQQSPTVSAASASANTSPNNVSNATWNTALNSAQEYAQGAAQDAAPGATPSGLPPPAGAHSHVSATRELSVRLSVPPGPPRSHDSHPEGRPIEDQASSVEPTEHSFGTDLDNACRNSSEKTAEPSSALKQARSEKRRASGDDIGTNPKRARQETLKHKYRELRVEIAGVFDRELDLVHSGESNIELSEGAQRYVDYLSQMGRGAMQKVRKADLNGIKEDYVGDLDELVVKAVQKYINEELARKGQHIQPRVSLSSKMEDEEDTNDQEPDSKARVKRE